MGASFFLFPDRAEPMSSFERLNFSLAGIGALPFERVTLNESLPVCYRLHTWGSGAERVDEIVAAVRAIDWEHGVHVLARSEPDERWDYHFTFGTPTLAPDGGP
jgi:hypothetical protein